MEEAIALDSIQAIAASFGASFDAEKIVDTVLEKDGTRYYKVRWVKYSWEPAASFTHLEHLIRAFWNQCNTNNQFDEIPGVSKKQTLRPDTFTNTNTTLVHQRNQNSDKTLPQLLNNLDATAVSNLEGVPNDQPLQLNEQRQPPMGASFSTHQLQTVGEGSAGGRGTHQSHLDIISNLHSALPLPLNTDQIQAIGNGETLLPPATKKRPRGVPKKRRKIPGSCNICGKQFKSTTNVAAHKKLHTEERQFECPQCGKKFRRKLHLTRHLESHAGIKSFECEICGSKFSSKWYMEAHKVIHTGDKPFECTLCDKRFNNKANLNKHKLIHGNKRPFVCNLCGQSYRQSYDLKRHMTTHSDLKSFVCVQCGKCFARKSYLQRHLVTHESERKYNCTLCDRTFTQRGQLNVHMKKHEDGNLTDNPDDPDEENCEQRKKVEILKSTLDAVEAFLNSPSNATEAVESNTEIQSSKEQSLVSTTFDTQKDGKRTSDGNSYREETVVLEEGEVPAVNKANSLQFVTTENHVMMSSFE